MNQQNKSTPDHPDAREGLGQPGGVDGGQQSQLDGDLKEKLADQLPTDTQFRQQAGGAVGQARESGEKDSVRDERQNRRNDVPQKIGDGE